MDLTNFFCNVELCKGDVNIIDRVALALFFSVKDTLFSVKDACACLVFFRVRVALAAFVFIFFFSDRVALAAVAFLLFFRDKVAAFAVLFCFSFKKA